MDDDFKNDMIELSRDCDDMFEDLIHLRQSLSPGDEKATVRKVLLYVEDAKRALDRAVLEMNSV